jgi:hypothetical protein
LKMHPLATLIELPIVFHSQGVPLVGRFFRNTASWEERQIVAHGQGTDGHDLRETIRGARLHRVRVRLLRVWRKPRRASTDLEVGYLRSVAIDPGEPEVVVVSASSGPYTAYVAGRSDGRLYRRLTRERWERIRDGWPEPPSTIAPLLCAGAKPGEMWAADERGVHRSDDSGKSWRRVVGYATSPQHLRGLALLQ